MANPAYAAEPNSMLPYGVSDGMFAAGLVISILSGQVALVRWAIQRMKQIEAQQKSATPNSYQKTDELAVSSEQFEPLDPIQFKTRQLIQLCHQIGYKALYEYLLIEDGSRLDVLCEFLKQARSRDEIDIVLKELQKHLNVEEYINQISQLYNRGCSQQVEIDLLYELSEHDGAQARSLIGRILETSQYAESKQCALYIISRTFPETDAIDQFHQVVESEVYDRIVRDACYYLSQIKHARASAILSEAALHHRYFMVRNAATCDLMESFPSIAVDVLACKGMMASSPQERIQVLSLLSQIPLHSARLASLNLYPFCRTTEERLYHRAFSLVGRTRTSYGEA